ncbi:hypothetical protein FZO89_12430 [Luteimonas viscosa]|uniref:Uncharacterized protein n=1 Tax=Luteimonas viscosa TaxID=1132694 RepID=A0A5D4XVW5_9GAMM|nr:hypothetical protein [Luteimonas viscosa]TYT27000.1 hypothetical protein FZO89_12430 [Luteimonas viscosa]
MSQDGTSSTDARAHLWIAGLCAVVAYLSPTRFQGLPGWLGAGGWLLLGVLVLANPTLAAARPRFTRHPGLASMLAFVSLSLIVGSVVVWPIDR